MFKRVTNKIIAMLLVIFMVCSLLQSLDVGATYVYADTLIGGSYTNMKEITYSPQDIKLYTVERDPSLDYAFFKFTADFEGPCTISLSDVNSFAYVIANDSGFDTGPDEGNPVLGLTNNLNYTFSVVAGNTYYLRLYSSLADFVAPISISALNANPSKAITAFNFKGLTPNVTGTVNEASKTIALTVPYGTYVTSLVPTITHTGASVSPNTGVAQNFTNPVTYTVTAADSSTQQYTVTVTVAADPAKAITAFNFKGLTPNVTGTVNEASKTIALTVPYGTDVTSLVPTITHTGASVSPNTGVAQNFTNPVEYTVTAADSATQKYTVTVTKAANPAKAITGVTVPVAGAVPTATIADTTEYTTTISWLPADATFKGSTVYTASITLTPKAGYTLTGVPANYFTVAGATATNTADSGIVTAVFPVTAPAVISTKAIAGVTVPVAGAVPTATIADATEYTATISWLPADATFKGSTVYTATITITPKAGYTLTGVPANFFTVDGATATNAADSGIVTAVFPETVPGVPTGVSAVSGNGQATVSFTAPSNNGGSAITGYTVTSSPGGFTGTGTTSPITVSGLTNGTAYTFTVTATNAAGTGAVSSASNSVTPQAQVAPTATVQPITGTLQVGATLTGHYTYSDVNGDLEGTSTYKWYRSDNAAGLNKTAIGGAISITYVLQNAETGKYISFEVTPVAATGISPGTAVESALVGAVTPPPPSVGGGSVTPPTPLTEIKNGGSTTGTNLSQLISGGKTLTVDGDKGEKIVFDTEALKGIAGQASGDIKVEMKDVSSTHQESLPGKQVFSLTVSSGSSTITNFGGAVTITLPYTLKDGETAEDVTVWYLADDGTMTEIPCTFDPATKLATFTVTHFSLYVVGVNAPWVNPFTDVSENDWFYGAVEFANRNGLFAGTGAATFSPNSPMTRAMLWTVLGRLDGQSLSGSAVFDTARVWAMGAGITDGTNPDGSITREQMVTILWRYAGLPKAGGDLSKFSDAGSVANYAADAMAWAVENGIIAGANGALMPQDNATRTQVAAILQRFIKVAAK